MKMTRRLEFFLIDYLCLRLARLRVLNNALEVGGLSGVTVTVGCLHGFASRARSKQKHFVIASDQTGREFRDWGHCLGLYPANVQSGFAIYVSAAASL
jgi:hypothetical protein